MSDKVNYTWTISHGKVALAKGHILTDERPCQLLADAVARALDGIPDRTDLTLSVTAHWSDWRSIRRKSSYTSGPNNHTLVEIAAAVGADIYDQAYGG